jgi:transposase
VVHVLPPALLGDRGYGFPHLIAVVVLYGIAALLSPRGRDKPHGSGLGKQRWVVERTFAWLGRSRRLAKDCERAPGSSAAMIQVSMIHMMLRRLAPPNKKRSQRFRYAA